VFLKESIDGIQTKKPLKFDKCVEEDWERFDAEPSDRKAFDRLKEKDVLFCLAPEDQQDHNLEIFGKDDTEDYRRLEMNLMACEDARQNCTKTKQEMLEYLGPLDLVIVYTSTSLAARKFKDPVNRSIKISNQQIDYEKPNFMHSKLQQTILEDDVNFFVQGIETEYEFWDLDRGLPEISSLVHYHTGRYKITGIEMLGSFDVIRINRETYSLLQFLGDLGGLYDAIFFTGVFVLAHINEVSLF